MRQILNISMPLNMIKIIKKEVKEGGYASVSEFLRYLIREWQQEKLLRELNQQTKDFEAGKGIVLKSFKDLDNL
ncbi:MAG: ribbon-helix-helix domain-containing protein [Candidatus Peregrinibacteria bacterium]|nr:ribbon-helix-helix domain-containing protein [Candidatus Peregrinibacteria bacterium]MDZ4244665.1 ribbon-helix-helix domain-containing protein [Candidatus Gracilibacteria bacterium]